MPLDTGPFAGILESEGQTARGQWAVCSGQWADAFPSLDAEQQDAAAA